VGRTRERRSRAFGETVLRKASPRGTALLRLIVAALAAAVPAANAGADEIRLADGSTLVGDVREWADGEVVVDTAFAEGLTIPAGQVVGLTLDEPRAVTLESGDRLVGRLVYEDGAQRLVETSFGPAQLDPASIISIADPEAPPPTQDRLEEAQRQIQELEQTREELEKAKEDEIAALREQHKAEVAKARDRPPPLDKVWSGRLEFSLDGQSGNSERVNLRFRAQATRETESERLNLFAESRFSREEGSETVNEIFGGARLDVFFAERWFAFGRTRFETDRFEDLDLRAEATVGAGYFVVKKPKHEFSVRAGVGFVFESFDDGTSESDVVAEAGYDWRLELDENLRLTHSLTYLPGLTDPATDFRLRVETALEVPIGDTEAWRIRAGLRNEFDNDPQPGVEELDNFYFVGLVYDW